MMETDQNDSSRGEISFEVWPMLRKKTTMPVDGTGGSGYNMDIGPDDIDVSDSVTVIRGIA